MPQVKLINLQNGFDGKNLPTDADRDVRTAKVRQLPTIPPSPMDLELLPKQASPIDSGILGSLFDYAKNSEELAKLIIEISRKNGK